VVTGNSRLRAAFAFVAALAIALGIAACGGGDDNDTGTSGGNSANLIKSNPANNGIQLTVGSKNFTEEFILGNIYAQALQAAGYDEYEPELGSEVIAYKALQDGEISGYPEYTSTLLQSIFGKETVPPMPRPPMRRRSRSWSRRARRRSPRRRSPTRTRWGC
jgi:glycine betaine/choline ABC-type transport system substrate-binding protein